MKYNAFISYSHAADGRMAPALQSALERFAKPWYKLRNLNLFRDESSLSATPHLWSNIQKALDNSEYLIYMASPESAISKWVNKEIEYWLTIRSLDTVLIVLTDGQLFYNSTISKDNALSLSLVGTFKEEPFYVDCRDMKSESDLTLNNPIFKKDILKLAAQLHGKAPKDLASEEVIAHRKMIWTRNIAVLLLLLLLTYSFLSTKSALDTIRLSKQQDIAIAKGELEQERLKSQTVKDSLILIEKEKERALANELKEAREQLAIRMIENTKAVANIALGMNETAKKMIKDFESETSILDNKKTENFTINPIFFDFDKFNIREDSKYELEITVEVLRQKPNLVVRLIVPYYFSLIDEKELQWIKKLPNTNNIEGFSKLEAVTTIIENNKKYLYETSGPIVTNPKYHEQLQKYRSKSIRDFLISRGVNPEKIVLSYKVVFADDVLTKLEGLKTQQEKQRLLQQNELISIEFANTN